jgi:hypothetical protein
MDRRVTSLTRTPTHVRATQAGHAGTVQLGRSGFSPVTVELFFLFSEYIQIPANLKSCVGFIWTQKIVKQILLDRS